MIKSRIESAINDQINAELYSAYLYLSMAGFFHEENLDGFATWMKDHAQEETDHAMRFFNYLVERGGRIKLDTIDQPEVNWEGAIDVFQAAYEHEQRVTQRIHDLYDLAKQEDDKATVSMLKWFIDEQVEEEDLFNGILQTLMKAEGKPSVVFMLDSKLQEGIDEE